VFAAEEGAFLLKTVTNDTDAAMRTRRRQGMDGAFEAIERMSLAVLDYLKGLVVIIPTRLAYCHDITSLIRNRLSRSDNPRMRSLS
jgi:hypothetical protein